MAYKIVFLWLAGWFFTLGALETVSANPFAPFEKQIDCPPERCLEFFWDSEKKNSSLIWKSLKNRAGKIVVHSQEKGTRLTDSLWEEHLEYLREISKRGGLVTFEPFYIQTRGMGLGDLPVFKDFLGVTLNLYQRLRSFFVFGTMKHYNAKVLYHPITYDIMLVFYYHKSYGTLCDTVYSKCDTIQYLDDAVFDLQLSEKLTKIQESERPIEVKFEQTQAVLPPTTLDLAQILEANQSVRLYKWLLACQSTETKPIVRERFLDLSLAITIIDYTLSAYEFVEAILLYKPARKTKAEAAYALGSEGKKLVSVTFYPAPE